MCPLCSVALLISFVFTDIYFLSNRGEIKELEKRKTQRRKKREKREKQEQQERQEKMMQLAQQNPQLAMMQSGMYGNMQPMQMPYNYNPPQQGGGGGQQSYAPQADQSGNPYAPRDGGGGGRR